MIDMKGMDGRVSRFNALFEGLGQEARLWQNGPLSNLERDEYLDALYGARIAIGRAAGILSKARARLEKEARSDG